MKERQKLLANQLNLDFVTSVKKIYKETMGLSFFMFHIFLNLLKAKIYFCPQK